MIIINRIHAENRDTDATMKRRDKAIFYEPHARRRMQQRGVSEQQVSQTVRNPDTRRPARRDDARRFEKALSSKRRLVVIARETDSSFTVISTFWA